MPGVRVNNQDVLKLRKRLAQIGMQQEQLEKEKQDTINLLNKKPLKQY
jgi:hypothetical protein